MLISLIIPVYNRPDEIKELLESLAVQTVKTFEVIIVEDGSELDSKAIIDVFSEELDLRYIQKTNSGPAHSRNKGVEVAKGEYVIFLDSDVVVPDSYIKQVVEDINKFDPDLFGGPDRSAESFTVIQKAIDYAMTSFLTTGGIRGSKKGLDKFYPRSFNMGVRKSVFESLGGFSVDMRFGEDIDFSVRVIDGGYKSMLFSDAWVYHKRRTGFRKFFRQVHNFGAARIALYKKYPHTLKAVHFLPAIFTIGCLVLVAGAIFCLYALLPLLLYTLMVFIDALVRKRSLTVAVCSVLASFIQLIGYGTGFISGWWNLMVMKKKKYFAFSKRFYK